MLLIAGLSGAQVAEAKMAADVKADAGLILERAPGARAVRQMVEAAGDIPLGVSVKDADAEKANELAGSGCDFLVFGIEAAAAILRKEDAGRFLMIERSLDQGLVRAVNSLDIDGVFISGAGGGSLLAVENLLVYRRFVELLEKPVMITLPSLVTSAELAILWQLGIDGVVAAPPQSVESLAKLKKMIGDLPGGARGRRAKVSAMLPRQSAAVDTDEDEEEEEV